MMKQIFWKYKKLKTGGFMILYWILIIVIIVALFD